MRYEPCKLTDKVAEFDLTLEYPGRWILRGQTLPEKGLWYERQEHAMGYARERTRDCASLIVRLHNQWGGQR